MKENTQEKSLVKVNENGIFYKIKNFFSSLFHKKEVVNNDTNFEIIEDTIDKAEQKSYFMESIKKTEDEETKLLKLQKQYRSGELKEEELTEAQVNSLCALYDKQIENLRKSNQVRKQKLLEYRRKLQADN